MQNTQQLQQKIEAYWAQHTNKTLKIDAEFEETVNEVLAMLNSGDLRVSNKPTQPNGEWTTNQWIKEAILLYFKLPNQFNITPHVTNNNQAHQTYYDKVPLKFTNWEEEEYEKSQIRVVSGTTVRNGTHIAKNSVIMTSFINTGVFIDEETMIDTLAAIGSCAQIGKRCHISAGAMIGGVLEPIQANPVIIEDNCFIGLNSGIAEGVIVREGSVISMGVNIGASTKILNRETGEITYGEIPARSVVVAGSIPSGGANIACAVIVKQVDEKTSAKTELNNILRAL